MRIFITLDAQERKPLQALVAALAPHANTPAQEFAVAGFVQRLKSEETLDLKDLAMLMRLIADIGADRSGVVNSGAHDFAREVNKQLRDWVTAVNKLRP